MEEGDEDKLLLSSLGISSANPEDIEREILSQVLRLVVAFAGPYCSSAILECNKFAKKHIRMS